METQIIQLSITKNEALVLFDFLTRFNKTQHSGIFEDQAEEKTLWVLETHLEKQLVEHFMPDYIDIIKKARASIRDEE